MQINVVDPVLQTNIFITLLVLAVVLSVKRKTAGNAFDTTFTNELRGAAILMVIFSHVGYFLFSDHRFIYPLSVAGGIGVNIFLFLSGFGLTASALKSGVKLRDFYIKRLKKIFIPMWLVLAIFLLLDAVFLRRFYPFQSVVQSIFGFFPRADVSLDVNSPLWYFTLILFYYLLFPWVFSRRLPVLSAVLFLLLGRFLVDLKLPVSVDVLKLYKLHYLAFPLGMCFATLLKRWPVASFAILRMPNIPRSVLLFAKFIVIIALVYVFCYTAIRSSIGAGVLREQLTSLLSVACLLAVFSLKGCHSRFLALLGTYSYEIYLIHWPLMSRYDFLYGRLPASIATFLYLAVLLTLGIGLKKLINQYGTPSDRTKN